MTVYQALQQMRLRSEQNVPFELSFIKCNLTIDEGGGLKVVKRAILRTGYSSTHSKKHNSLVAYTDLDTQKPGMFYIPLLISINQTTLE